MKMNSILRNGLRNSVARLPQMQLMRKFAEEKKKVERFMWCQTEYKQPKAVLCNGLEMPLLGIGTWLPYSTLSKLSAQTPAYEAESNLEHLIRLDFQLPTLHDRLTGIVCTIGPASQSVPILEQMIENGMDIARLNFSQGTQEYHAKSIQNIREASANHSKNVGYYHATAIALDTRGPEIRTGVMGGGDPNAQVELKLGDLVKLTPNREFMEKCSKDYIYVDYPNIVNILAVGNHIYIDDGLLMLTVESVDADSLTCRIENNGVLSSRKGVNLPGVNNDLPNVSEKDKSDLLFGVAQKVDFIFASFIQNAAGITEIRDILGEAGKNIKIIAKIENHMGMRNLDEIIAASDGLIVARGDLGIEIEPEKVFLAQKSMIARCNKRGKPVICATQMLESMTKNPRATRAELSDVANAVLDGSDCVMLSGETAKGNYPTKCVAIMDKVCREAEAAIWKKNLFLDLVRSIESDTISVTHTLAIAATEASNNCRAAAIFVSSATGKSAAFISNYHPRCPIIMITGNKRIARFSLIYHGLIPLVYKDAQQKNWVNSIDDQFSFGMDIAKQRGYVKTGEKVVLVMRWKHDPKFVDTIRITTVS